ncbi:MAG: hypothetical protein GF416_04780 [Candidatus Altiarchaeales archaeon]|nr:hypothetical protein [Candidatus Altiarchaeales archaeon]MBD3416435.1 hypothetical protein [Candidatus Altiarchaeales archaeon]
MECRGALVLLMVFSGCIGVEDGLPEECGLKIEFHGVGDAAFARAVLEYYGINRSLEVLEGDLAMEAGTGRLDRMKSLLRMHGLHVEEGKAMDWEELGVHVCEEGNTAILFHREGETFMAVLGFEGGRVYAEDQREGLVRFTRDEFMLSTLQDGKLVVHGRLLEGKPLCI